MWTSVILLTFTLLFAPSEGWVRPTPRSFRNPGICPARVSLTTNSLRCQDDSWCLPRQKCCDSYTRYGSICVDAVYRRPNTKDLIVQPGVKPGNCESSVHWNCIPGVTSNCDRDYDCPGDRKCCRTNCGTFCVSPNVVKVSPRG